MSRLAIFGPLPPPTSGMETFTLLLLEQLKSRDGELDWTHIDTSMSSTNADRGLFRVGKVARLLSQVGASVRAAFGGYDAYYPISQSRHGLTRDLVLLTPFRLARRRIVVHLHGGALHRVLPEQPPWLRAWLQSTLKRGATTGISLTESLKVCLEPLIPRDSIFVVANSAFSPERTGPKVAPPPLRVAFLSTLYESKGYRELIDAVEELAADGLDIVAEIAGEPGGPADSLWLERRRSQAKATAIVGPVEGHAKSDLLARAHVLALPSSYPFEGQPISILEGMANGCAIVCTPHAGIPETIAPDEAVYVDAAPGPPLRAAIRDALRQLVKEPSLLDDRMRKARARYERDFTPDRFIANWLAAVERR